VHAHSNARRMTDVALVRVEAFMSGNQSL